VEGETLVRISTARHLRDLGFTVVEARNADEALEILDHFHVDVVFTDIAMLGHIDGLGFTRWLRQHRPTVKLIVTSGAEATSAAAIGYDMFLSKPYRPVDLDYCLERVVGLGGGLRLRKRAVVSVMLGRKLREAWSNTLRTAFRRKA
jgi:CheY-like chemotaxis protein